MPEGYYQAEEGDCSYSCLDELLCEYVDGTMDPTVRDAFEEYLQTDAALVEQIHRLRCTRSLLCHHGCGIHAPHGLHARVRQRLAGEMMQTEAHSFSMVASRLGFFATLASATVIVMMAGMFVGTLITSEAPPDLAAQKEQTPVTPQRTRTWDAQRTSSMSPLVHPHALRPGWYDRQAAPMLLPAWDASSGFRVPEALFLADTLHRTGGLQRTDAFP